MGRYLTVLRRVSGRLMARLILRKQQPGISLANRGDFPVTTPWTMEAWAKPTTDRNVVCVGAALPITVLYGASTGSNLANLVFGEAQMLTQPEYILLRFITLLEPSMD